MLVLDRGEISVCVSAITLRGVGNVEVLASLARRKRAFVSRLKPVDPLELRARGKAAAPVDKRNSGVASAPTSPRGGTKIARVIELLQRGDGATLAELVVATGWLPHTTRAALTGLRKRGYAVGIDRTDKARGSVHRIAPTERSDDSVASHVEVRTCE